MKKLRFQIICVKNVCVKNCVKYACVKKARVKKCVLFDIRSLVALISASAGQISPLLFLNSHSLPVTKNCKTRD